MSNFDISVNGIEKLQTDLNPIKVTRPDNILTRILKMMAHDIAPTLATVFSSENLLKQVNYLRLANRLQFSRKEGGGGHT